ncbi:TPR-containing protein DDB_G0280363-like [Littorina saxatilis]|uniref:Transmembrane protein n=1 Tax=Littorina saxatilis TaxID=31220 RepID=A0AAN9BRH9_9CAEN
MTPSPVLVVFAISFIAVVLGADVTVTTSDGDESGVNDVSKVRAGGGEGMEEEVLGPLRIWHIVFLVALVVLIAVTVVCCCVECRIPRTRQEIEEAYRQRQMNRKYLRQLERTPETILSRTDTETTDDQNEESSDHDHDRVVRKHPPQTQPHPGQQNQRHTNNIATTSHQRHDTGQEPRQQRHHHHNNHPHHHQQQRQQTHSQQQADATANVGVAVTESSARLSRLPKSQMFGVHTPFSLGAITAMQKQKQSQRQQQQQT